jgi:hypothetical protein
MIFQMVISSKLDLKLTIDMRDAAYFEQASCAGLGLLYILVRSCII